MKIPKRIMPLVESGLVDEVIGRLMSGKEADVFIVRSGSEIRCAKVYKEANKRSFKQAVLYQEGRKVRNSRRARAMEKGSKFGRDSRKNPGKTPKWMRSTDWPMRECAYPKPTAALMAYYSWN